MGRGRVRGARGREILKGRAEGLVRPGLAVLGGPPGP